MTQQDKKIAWQVENNNTPSIQYILFSQENIIQYSSYGMADIKSNKPVEEKNTYNACSVTKTFTALAVLQLAEQKKLGIDLPIKYHLQNFPYSSEITIRQLLSHTGGIPNPLPLNWIHLPAEQSTFDRNEFFKTIFSKYNKASSAPNEKYYYSNLGYVLLGQLIEKVSGISYEQYIRENIINRLGLRENDLSFTIKECSLHTKGYQKNYSFFNLILGFLIDKSKFMGNTEGKWKPFNNYYINGASYGGLIGTPLAFVKYIQELLKPDCRLLSEPYKKMLFTENFTSNNKATGMCLSWFTGELKQHKYYAHAGGGGGYYCEIRIYPEPGIGSVVFFNRTGISDERFLDKADEAYFNKDY